MSNTFGCCILATIVILLVSINKNSQNIDILQTKVYTLINILSHLELVAYSLKSEALSFAAGASSSAKEILEQSYFRGEINNDKHI